MAKQRQVRIEQGLPQNLMERMQDRTDEELEAETKYRSIALAILGARAAERYDAAKARTYFQRAIAASRPQERMQIRRMADASLALAERRADDLKSAVEKLGGEAPSSRALMGLRLMALIAPPPGAGPLLKARGFAIVVLLVVAILGLGLGLVELVSLLFGGIGFAPALLLGLIVVGVALAVLAYVGRRRQAKARAAGRTAGGGRGAPAGKGAAAAKGQAAGKGAPAAKAQAAGKGAPAAKAQAPGKGATAAKAQAAGKGGATPAKAKGAAPARGAGASNGSGSARRPGGSPRVTGPAKGPAPAKPAKGGTPPKGGRPTRPKRPSR